MFSANLIILFKLILIKKRYKFLKIFTTMEPLEKTLEYGGGNEEELHQIPLHTVIQDY